MTLWGAGQIRDAAGNIITPAVRGVANVYAADLGAPEVASTDWFFSGDMANGSYELVQTTPPDGLARNVTATATAVGAADTAGSLLVTGRDNLGRIITEEITPAQGSTVEGARAFASLTTVVGSGWTVDEDNDTIEIGFGDLLGLPSAIRDDPAMTSADQVISGFFGGAATDVPVVAFDASELSLCTVDASVSGYDGVSRLQILIVR
jgi:hypothetical protein